MGWRFRKSFTVMPGVRLNVSRRGVSATVGARPLSLNVGPRGAYVNASVPGTGVGFRQRLGAPASRGADGQPNDASSARTRPARAAVSAPRESPEPAAADLILPAEAPGVSPEFRAALDRLRQGRAAEAHRREVAYAAGEIRSASTAVLTSPHLADFRDALIIAQGERDDIERALGAARPAAARAGSQYRAWADGFFWRRVRKARFAALASEAEETHARVAELEAQLGLTALAADVCIAPEDADDYGAMVDAFDVLSRSAAIWDTTHSVATDRVRERTIAAESIRRTPVRFAAGAADVLASDRRVPLLGNANGGDLYLYPGFVLYRVSRGAFAVLEARDVAVEHAATRFVETEGVPSDAEVVGQTWRYANKDGSRDRRYADNPPVPLAQYGTLQFRSASGLCEAYLVSNAAAARRFAEAWARYADPAGPPPPSELPVRGRGGRPPRKQPPAVHRAISPAAQALIDTRPRAWEHRLFAQVLADEVAHAAPAHRRAFETLPAPTGETVGAGAVPTWVGQRCEEARRLLETLDRQVQRTLPVALGPAGEPGDPNTLVVVGRTVAGCYGDALEWRTRVRGALLPPDFADAQAALASLGDVWLTEVQAFGPRALRTVDDALARLDAGGSPEQLALRLVVALPHGAVERVEAALARVAAGG